MSSLSCSPGLIVYRLSPSKTQDDCFLFGTDEVSPQDQHTYIRACYQCGPLQKLLDNQASEDKLPSLSTLTVSQGPFTRYMCDWYNSQFAAAQRCQRMRNSNE